MMTCHGLITEIKTSKEKSFIIEKWKKIDEFFKKGGIEKPAIH